MTFKYSQIECSTSSYKKRPYLIDLEVNQILEWTFSLERLIGTSWQITRTWCNIVKINVDY